MHPIKPVSLVLVAAVLASCSGDITSTPFPASISILPPSASMDALGATQSFQVIVKDQRGATMESQSVQWSVAPAAVATISTQGTATAQANGTAQIIAKSGSLQATASLSVQQRVQTLTILSGDNQQGPVGSQLAIPLRVSARDRLNNPVAGAQVLFEVSSNGGTVSSVSVTTNAAGEASTLWTLPNVASTSHMVTARVNETSAAPVVFSAIASAQTTGASEFNIDLRFLSAITPSQQAIFNSAAARWKSIITGDLLPVTLNVGPGDCGGNSPAFNELVDDLVIFVSLEPIDEVGKTLGQAGPCRIRSGSLLPISGLMLFDVADIAALESNGILEAVILHEMGHVLGIGTLWPLKSLLVNPSLPSNSGVDTHFSGVNAIAAFDLIGGASYTGQKVPVENTQGAEGTRDAHWRESVFRNELMTGFVANGANPLSIVTVRSLQDLGYEVNAGAADPYFLPGAGVLLEPLPSIHLLRDIAPIPIRIGGR